MNTNNINDIIASAFNGLTLRDSSNADAVASLLDRFNLRWNVVKTPLMLPNGSCTPFYGIVREDTNQVFTTCKDSYVPFQNSELGELLIRISDKTGYQIHSGGNFNGGGKVYLQLDTGNAIKGIGKNNSSVKGYVTGINSHDGTQSLKWGAVNFTICCRNTFAMAGRTLQNAARHTASIKDRVDAAIREIEGVNEQEKSIFEQFIRLSEIPVTKSNIVKIVRDVTGVDIDKARQDKKEFSAQAIKKATDLTSSIARELEQKGDTLWGLFSGVTHYTSHVMTAPKRDNGRLESKYVGTGADIDNRTFASVMALAN